MTTDTIPSAAPQGYSALVLAEPAGVPVKGMVAGLLGGLIGSLVMIQFQDRWGARFELGDAGTGTAGELGGPSGRTEQDGIEHFASGIAQRMLGHDLDLESRSAAGQALKIAYGALAGGIYGATAEGAPEVTRGTGIPFGHAVWALADEVMGLEDATPNEGDGERRFPTGISSLLARFVYGVTTESVRRAVRSRL